MSGASDTLDPIAAAEADIAGSKHLIAAVTRELGQHERWLAHYEMAEKRHARRVMLQRILYRLELARQSALRGLRRFALRTARLALVFSAFLARTTVALLEALRRGSIAAFAWIRPRAYALGGLLRRWLRAFWSWFLATSARVARIALEASTVALAWLAVKARNLALLLARWLASAWAWTSRQAIVIARVSLKAGSLGLAWLRVHLRKAAVQTERWLARAASWSARETRIVSDISVGYAKKGASWVSHEAKILAAVSKGYGASGAAWTAAHSRRLAIRSRHASTTLARQIRAQSQALAASAKRKIGHFSRASFATASLGFAWSGPAARPTGCTALVVRRSTALICIENRGSQLPALRA